MTISAHLTTYAGRRVQDWRLDAGPIDPSVYYRVSLAYDEAESGEQWSDRFAELLDHPGAVALEGIIVGAWGQMFDEQEDATRVVEALVAAAARDLLRRYHLRGVRDLLDPEH
ncbi:MAG TPA: hypothetical protein VGJ87_00100 [Roseiflexaceae bacterium]